MIKKRKVDFKEPAPAIEAASLGEGNGEIN
jgi:hypothetical protein